MKAPELPTVLRELRFPASATLAPQPSRNLQKANSLYLTLPNGVTVSIIWGPATYTDNYDAMDTYSGGGDIGAFWNKPRDSTTAELAIWDKDESWITHEFTGEPGDMVIGYADAETVQRVIDWAVAR